MHKCTAQDMVKTDDTLTTSTGITYRVFECDKCGESYIKRLYMFLGVEYSSTGEWARCGRTIKIEPPAIDWESTEQTPPTPY